MDLADLYRDVIVDHNRNPRNAGRLAHPDRTAEGHNPLCGDRLHIDLELDGDLIRDVRFECKGCAISTASASLMSEAIKGRRLVDVQHLFGEVHDMLTRQDAPVPADLGKLAALSGVREFPARVKCASLCWHTLNAALANEASPATTE
jgi:nitrogen fixation protein NifU and related proteins